MSTDCVLVTADPPTLDDLRVGGMQAVSLGRLDRYQLDGSWEDDPVVGFAGHLAEGQPLMLMQVGRPRHVLAADAADLSADLFAAAPDDGSGRLWLTDVTMVTPLEPARAERHFLALMAVASPIALARKGYLVLTSGGPTVVELDGVPAPEPLSLDDLPERPRPIPPAQVFVGAILVLPGGGVAGWHNAREAVSVLSSGTPSLQPDHLLADEAWQPMPDEAPAWWPMQQNLFASGARFSWLVDGSERGDLGSVTTVVGQGPAPDQASTAFGDGLVALSSRSLDYGFAHPWHADEPWTGPVGPRMTGNGPYFMLVARHLDRGLPNLYWLQVLGPRWVERIGAERIAGTPAYRVEEVAPEHWLVQLAPSLASVVEDYDGFLAARKATVDHLGREHFPFLD